LNACEAKLIGFRVYIPIFDHVFERVKLVLSASFKHIRSTFMTAVEIRFVMFENTRINSTPF
jgi:hypothetical protein